jgi:3-methyladenine DNA glycosylase AlkD
VTAADTIDAALRASGRPARAVQEKAYLKSTLEHYGCDAAATREAVRTVTITARPELLVTVKGLWKPPIYERRAAAALLLVRHVKLLTASDLALVETLVRASKTWALVDQLAVHVVGPMVAADRRPLDRWARDDDFWIRRSAMLGLLLELRRGKGDWERFARYADRMLEEKEFFIRKAIGWILREVSKQRPALVTAWLTPRAARASGVTLREAVKYLPAADRDAITASR